MFDQNYSCAHQFAGSALRIGYAQQAFISAFLVAADNYSRLVICIIKSAMRVSEFPCARISRERRHAIQRAVS